MTFWIMEEMGEVKEWKRVVAVGEGTVKGRDFRLRVDFEEEVGDERVGEEE